MFNLRASGFRLSCDSDLFFFYTKLNVAFNFCGGGVCVSGGGGGGGVGSYNNISNISTDTTIQQSYIHQIQKNQKFNSSEQAKLPQLLF